MNYNLQVVREIENETRRFVSGGHSVTNTGTKDRYAEEHMRNIEHIVKKYGCTKEIKKLQNGINKYTIKDAKGKIVSEYHDI